MATQKSRIIKHGYDNSSGGSGGGGGGSSSTERTVAVDPVTYQPSGSSTFRVPESQVGNPPSGAGGGGGGTSPAATPTTQEQTRESSSQEFKDYRTESLQQRAAEKAAEGGYATQAQLARVEQEKRTVSVAVDKKAVEELNAATPGGAQEYFKQVREASGEPFPVEIVTFSVPRTISPGETEPRPSEYTFTGEFTPVPYKPPFSTDLSPPTTGEKVQEFFKTRAEQSPDAFRDYPAIIRVPGQAAVTFIGGIVKGTQGATEYIIYQGKDFLKRPLDPERPFNIITDVATGTSEYLGDTVDVVLKGDIPGIAEKAGEFVAYDRIGAVIKGGAKEAGAVAREVATDFPRTRADIKFRDAVGSTPTDFNYEFAVNKFNTQGRVGVIVPPEYLGALGVKGVELPGGQVILKSPELQTQLYPKVLSASEVQAYLKAEGFEAANPPRPSSLSEVARQDPLLGKELAKESGQTVFNPEEVPRVRDLTPEERLRVAKEQAGANPPDLQTTLPGYVPKPGSDVVILKNGQKVATIKGKTVEIKEPPIFAVTDPISGTILTIVRERQGIYDIAREDLRKVKRTALTIAGPEVLKEIKTGDGYPLVLIKEYSVVDAGTTPITALTLRGSQVKQPATLPAIKARTLSKNLPSTDTSTGIGSRSQPATNTETVTEQITEQRQESILATPPVQNVQQTSRQRFETTPPEIIETPRPPFLPGKAPQKEQSRGNVTLEIRKRGRFEPAGTFEEGSQGFEVGKEKTRQTAAASFRLKDEQGNILTEQFGSLDQDFKKSTRETGVFIQKRSKRISTAGEKQEITAKGILTSRNKGKKKGGSLWAL